MEPAPPRDVPHQAGKPRSPPGHTHGEGTAWCPSVSLGVPKSSQGGRSGVQPPFWAQRCPGGSRRDVGAWQGPSRRAPNAGGERDPAQLPRHPRTPPGIPAGPRGRATTPRPVPTCRCRQRVWDFKGSRLNLEPLSSSWQKGSWGGNCSVGRAPWEGLAEPPLPKNLPGRWGHLANSAGFLCRGARLGPCPAAPIPLLLAWEGKATRLHPDRIWGLRLKASPGDGQGTGVLREGSPGRGWAPTGSQRSTQRGALGVGERGAPGGFTPCISAWGGEGLLQHPPQCPCGCRGSVGAGGLWVSGTHGCQGGWFGTGRVPRCG